MEMSAKKQKRCVCVNVIETFTVENYMVLPDFILANMPFSWYQIYVTICNTKVLHNNIYVFLSAKLYMDCLYSWLQYFVLKSLVTRKNLIILRSCNIYIRFPELPFSCCASSLIMVHFCNDLEVTLGNHGLIRC